MNVKFTVDASSVYLKERKMKDAKLYVYCEGCGEDTPHDQFPSGYQCRECGERTTDGTTQWEKR